jgi:MFS family permease
VVITELVGDAEIANAVGLNSAVLTGSRVVGPALAAWLINGVGIGWCFVANAASFVAMLVALLMINPADLHVSERIAKEKGQIIEGFRYVWRNDELRLAIVLMGVVATLSFNWQVLLPLLAEHEFHGNENTYAFITTVFSIGSLTGSLLIARRTTMDNRLLARASVGLGIASFLVALAPSVPAAAIAGALAGATGIAFLSATMTALQLHSIPVMRGRVMALYSMLFLGSTPIGGPLCGWIAQAFGTRWAIAMGAAAALASGVAGLFVLRRRTHDAEAGEPERAMLEAAA